jgi:Tfp pilus assembly protein PilF
MRNFKIFWLPSYIAILFLVLISGCGTQSTPTPILDAHTYLAKGIDYYDNGQFEEAREEYARAIELDPNFVDGYLGMAHSEHALKNWEKAIQAYDKAIELDPDLPAAVYVSRGNAYREVEAWENAIVDFSHAITLEVETPSDQAILIMAYKGRAHAYVALYNDGQARQDYETILSLDPNDPEASVIEGILERIKPEQVRSTPKDSQTLCDWFVEAQLLRFNRFSGLKKFTEFYQKYGSEGFTFNDPSNLEERMAALIEAFEEYVPYEREFIEKWEQLGSISEASDFWEKELEAERQKLIAMEKIITAVKTENDILRLEGAKEWDQAILIGRESENAMLEIRNKCLEETN